MNKLLNHSYIEIKLKDKKDLKLKFNFKYSKQINTVNYDCKIYTILSKYKQYIDDYYENWNGPVWRFA